MKPWYLHIGLLLLLPLVMVLDVVVFFWTQTGCLQLGCFSEFIRTTSLSGGIIADTVRAWSTTRRS